MKDHGDETESTVSKDGITVYQTYQEEQTGVPTVALKFVSERDDPADVRAVVDLPPDLHTAEVGFHPDYRREDWSVENDRLKFTTEIGPDEEVTTMYATEAQTDESVDSLLDNLTIQRVAGDAAGTTEYASGSEASPAETVAESDDPASDSDTVSRAVEGETETETENGDRDDADAGSVGEETEADGTLDSLGPSEIVSGEDDEETAIDDSDSDTSAPDEDVEGPSDADADGAGALERAALSEYSTAELVAELDERIQAGQVTDEDSDRISDLLQDESEDATAGDDLRVAHLQQRVSDLEASVESIADLDDRHGTPAEAFAALDERVAAIDDEVSATTDRVSEVEPRLDDIEDEIASLVEQQAEFESEITDLKEWREQVKSTLSALGES